MIILLNLPRIQTRVCDCTSTHPVSKTGAKEKESKVSTSEKGVKTENGSDSSIQGLRKRLRNVRSSSYRVCVCVSKAHYKEQE
jgi:hypothetical protein